MEQQTEKEKKLFRQIRYVPFSIARTIRQLLYRLRIQKAIRDRSQQRPAHQLPQLAV